VLFRREAKRASILVCSPLLEEKLQIAKWFEQNLIKKNKKEPPFDEEKFFVFFVRGVGMGREVVQIQIKPRHKPK
jgi:hypothetical protein